MDRTKTLSEQLESAGNDKNLQNLIFRYYQGLEMGDSHWRESMHLDKFQAEGKSIASFCEDMPKSKRQLEEERLAKAHPNVDINLLMLQKKYGRGRDF